MLVMDELLTVEEVAKKLRVSKDTVWRLLREKKLVGYRMSGAWRIYSDDLKRYIDSRRNTEES